MLSTLFGLCVALHKILTDPEKEREGKVFVFQTAHLRIFPSRSNKRKTANPTLSPAEAGLSRVKTNEKNKREESVFYILL